MTEEKHFIGLDLGSRRSKGVLMRGREIIDRAIFESWALNKQDVITWTNAHSPHRVGTTGYSRRLAGQEFTARVITEIKAFALGAGFFCPGARTLIDIGGQDAKVIKLGPDGQALDFEMNDRCAAGTGKFFEMAAKTLGLPLPQMPEAALASISLLPVNSTCAVFAESEIIGLLADGKNPAAIARGIYKSVAERLNAMLQRLGHEEPVILVGGGANPCLARELSNLLDCPVRIPPEAPFFGAVGVALHAGKETEDHD